MCQIRLALLENADNPYHPANLRHDCHACVSKADLGHGRVHMVRLFAVQHGHCERTGKRAVGIQCYRVTAHKQGVATVLAGGSNSQVESSAAGYRLKSPAAQCSYGADVLAPAAAVVSPWKPTKVQLGINKAFVVPRSLCTQAQR